MAIFPQLQSEAVIQTGDKIRLDGSKSFLSPDEAAISLVEIEPESGSGFIQVATTESASAYVLDWVYTGATRTVTATIRITTDGVPVTTTLGISVVTSADDKLFSTDGDIIMIESDITKKIPKGRSSYLNVHRRAQARIVSELNDRGITNTDGGRITKDAIIDVEEVKQWSIYLALEIIFRDLSNAVDDVFMQKSLEYSKEVDYHRNKCFIRL